jgi:hypothetical protein
MTNTIKNNERREMDRIKKRQKRKKMKKKTGLSRATLKLLFMQPFLFSMKLQNGAQPSSGAIGIGRQSLAPTFSFH